MHFHGSTTAEKRPPEPGLAVSAASKNGRVLATGKAMRALASLAQVAAHYRVFHFQSFGGLGDDLMERAGRLS